MDEKDEKRIEESFGNYRSKELPKPLMENYAEGVWKKIAQAEQSDRFKLLLGMACAAVAILLLAGLVFGTSMKRQVLVLGPDTRIEAIEAQPGEGVDEAKQGDQVLSDKELFDEVSRDLFILEVLGEEEGLVDDTEITGDIELFEQIASEIPAL